MVAIRERLYAHPVYYCTSWPNLRNRTSKLFRHVATYLPVNTLLHLRRLET